MRRRPLAVLSSAALLVALPAAAQYSPPRPLPPPCDPGQFAVPGTPLAGVGAPDGDAIVLAPPEVSIGSGCPPAAARFKQTPRGTRVKVRWRLPTCARGPAKLVATVRAPECELLEGFFKQRGVPGRRRFRATRMLPVATTCTQEDDTLAAIQRRVFGPRGCTVVTCHGGYAQGALDLSEHAAYASLVGTPAVNPAAAAAGKLRVAPGDAGGSFLSQKLRGTLAAGEGARMPLVGPVLSALEIELIDAWIAAGAPRTGHVPETQCLPRPTYVPAEPLAPPPGGFQLVLEGPTLAPGQEQEGCLWVRVPVAADFPVGRWEFSLNPGTHHFAVMPFTGVGAPPAGAWRPGDVACLSGAMFNDTLSGASSAPYFVDQLPAGVARVLRPGQWVGLNAHYANEFDVPIAMTVWVNVHPYAGTPEHVARSLTDFDDMFSIAVPPREQRIQHGRYTNLEGRPISLLGIAGHMHKRGLRFTAWLSNGTKAYQTFDWAHPGGRGFDPPLVLPPGDWIDYECLHDNGVQRPVRRDFAGRPTTLRFGVTTEDEMCVLTGVYYTD